MDSTTRVYDELDDDGAPHSSPSVGPSSAPSTPYDGMSGMCFEGSNFKVEGASENSDSASDVDAAQSVALDVPPVTTRPANPSVFVYPTRSLLAGVRRDSSRRDSPTPTLPPTPPNGLSDAPTGYLQPQDVTSAKGRCPSAANVAAPPIEESESSRHKDAVTAAASSLIAPAASSSLYGALPPRSSIVFLPPVDSPRVLTRENDSSISPEYKSRQLGEPDQAARDAQRASEAREQKLEHEAQMREFVTTRLRHERDKDGNHLVLGYAGNITRCEDEPIRIPGAVQAFGVLVALRQSPNCGFEVRQVSENSTRILGLSPTYLFGLECFTDTLPEGQAETLFHNLEFLSSLPLDQADSADHMPQLLEVCGFGEPGSALQGDASDEQDRRRWHCTCALHRAPQPPLIAGEAPRRPLLVLEFELYDDTINPMMPQCSSPASSNTTTAQSRAGSSASEPCTTSAGAASEGPTDGRRPKLTSARLSKILPSPSADEIRLSTTMFSSPIREIERARAACGNQPIQFTHAVGASGRGALAPASRSAEGGSRRAFRESLKTNAPRDVFVDMVAVMNQCNDQLTAARDMVHFLNVVVGLVKYLTGFHRVLVYEFDDEWNGQTVAELVDPTRSIDMFRGLHFPASDIPKQARDLYAINKVRSLYNRDHPSARLVCKSEEDLETPLDMTHSLLRAMSPIHLKYLANMKVRASMSISIIGFGKLWGLIACHSYGEEGMRVSFHMRHMLRLLADAVSRNLERLSVTERLPARTLLNTRLKTPNPSEYITSNAEDLLTLFEADYGILIVGNGAKIMGENVCGQELLIIAEYLRLKRFPHVFATKCLTEDYPDLFLPSGPGVIAGMLYVPLTPDGKNFITFLRKTRVQYVHWAGQPTKKENEFGFALNPRDSFAAWTQCVYGKCKTWTGEQIETAAILAFVYGKFIEVWRENQSAAEHSDFTNLLLANASHEVRTPLNQIIGFLELALATPLNDDTRKNLVHTHRASQSLLFTINDLLDMTRLETGQETFFKEPFDLPAAIMDATRIYEKEAVRRSISFVLDTATAPPMVWGDVKKIRTAVANLTANAVKYTTEGAITVACRVFEEPGKQRAPGQVVVSVSIEDTGCGIPDDQLASLFRQIEQYQKAGARSESASQAHASEPEVGSSNWTSSTGSSAHSQSREMDRRRLPLGLGLAVVARIVQQLGGQLRVESKVGKGSTFAFVVPFLCYEPGQTYEQARLSSAGAHIEDRRIAGTRRHSSGSPGSPSTHLLRDDSLRKARSDGPRGNNPLRRRETGDSVLEAIPIPAQATQFEGIAGDRRPHGPVERVGTATEGAKEQPGVPSRRDSASSGPADGSLRVMVVDDDPLNRTMLAKRFQAYGHAVKQCSDGIDAVDVLSKGDFAFDCILMDIQMPLMNGFDATKRIRELEDEKLAIAPSLDAPSTLSRARNMRIPVFAVSASLRENERGELLDVGFDGWLLKPIKCQRLRDIVGGIQDRDQRASDVYAPGCSWEDGGWLSHRPDSPAEVGLSSPLYDPEDATPTGADSKSYY